MEEEDETLGSFQLDLINISRLVTSLSADELFQKILKFKNEKNRIESFLRDYFQNDEQLNILPTLTQEIKIIKRILPNFPIDDVINELKILSDAKDKIRLVMKRYFQTTNNDVKSVKRSLEENDLSNVPTKIQKVNEEISTFSNIINLISDKNNEIIINSSSDDSNKTLNEEFKEQNSPYNHFNNFFVDVPEQQPLQSFQDAFFKEKKCGKIKPYEELSPEAISVIKCLNNSYIQKREADNLNAEKFCNSKPVTATVTCNLDEKYDNLNSQSIYSDLEKNKIHDYFIALTNESYSNKEKCNIGNTFAINNGSQAEQVNSSDSDVTQPPVNNTSYNSLFQNINSDSDDSICNKDLNKPLHISDIDDLNFKDKTLFDIITDLYPNIDIMEASNALTSADIDIFNVPDIETIKSAMNVINKHFDLEDLENDIKMPAGLNNNVATTDTNKTDEKNVTLINIFELSNVSRKRLANKANLAKFKVKSKASKPMNFVQYLDRRSIELQKSESRKLKKKVQNSLTSKNITENYNLRHKVKNESENNRRLIPATIVRPEQAKRNVAITEINIDNIRMMFQNKNEQAAKENERLDKEIIPFKKNQSKKEYDDDDDCKVLWIPHLSEQIIAISDEIEEPRLESSSIKQNRSHYYKLLELFPDICPIYLHELCDGKPANNESFDELINVLLTSDYKKREISEKSPEPQLDFDEQYKILLDLFPNADPTYLQHHCERLIDQPDNLRQFVAVLFESGNYPTKSEYLRKLKLSTQEKQLTTEFDVKKFLEAIPDPEKYYNEHRRSVSDGYNYALTFLKNHYASVTIKEITFIFRKCEFSIIAASEMLDRHPRSMKVKRKLYPLTSCTNIPLLQEIAYVEHKTEILEYLKEQEKQKQEAKNKARAAGLLQTCGCCFDEEIMPEDVIICEDNHLFCKECVRKSCEIKIGEGKLDFPCLADCNRVFSLQTLQSVLTPKVFSKLAQRKQFEEVKSAGIEDLEFCPFCDFATIPVQGDKLFRCLNPDCMKESCRNCKEPSHIPLRCDEVEQEDDVKLRTYIENKMTEALVRKCYKCGLKFIKESGCNKMTCSCGAMMCYICNKPVKDYKHFNGQGGNKFHLCPLYSDINKMHMKEVKRSGEKAKKELGISSKQLKIDPTQNIEEHYRSLPNENNNINNLIDMELQHEIFMYNLH